MTFFELKNYMLRELSQAVKQLKTDGIIKDENNFSPSADVSIVLREIFGLSKTEYYTGKDFSVSEQDCAAAVRALSELKALKPVQYITHKCEFMSLDFFVNENTLIPRPDTETLVEHILDCCKKIPRGNIKLLDIGTGSGCIAVSLLYYLKTARAACTDISAEALSNARLNAEANNIGSRITFIKNNVLNGFPIFPPEFDDGFDFIISNPPYIKTEEILNLEKNVSNYEPELALDGGADGLKFYRKIIAETISSYCLKPGGILAFETGCDQGQAVSELLTETGRFDNILIIKDLSGNNRVVSAALK